MSVTFLLTSFGVALRLKGWQGTFGAPDWTGSNPKTGKGSY